AARLSGRARRGGGARGAGRAGQGQAARFGKADEVGNRFLYSESCPAKATRAARSATVTSRPRTCTPWAASERRLRDGHSGVMPRRDASVRLPNGSRNSLLPWPCPSAALMSQSARRSIEVRTLRLLRSRSIRQEPRDNSPATLRAKALSPSK